MASFKVSYNLSGEIIIKSDSELEVEDRLKGYHTSEEDVITDNMLISGIAGYQDLKRKSGYRIESDAIVITNIEECKEERMENNKHGDI